LNKEVSKPQVVPSYIVKSDHDRSWYTSSRIICYGSGIETPVLRVPRVLREANFLIPAALTCERLVDPNPSNQTPAISRFVGMLCGRESIRRSTEAALFPWRNSIQRCNWPSIGYVICLINSIAA
jgi:hypothetical protein